MLNKDGVEGGVVLSVEQQNAIIAAKRRAAPKEPPMQTEPKEAEDDKPRAGTKAKGGG